MKGLFFLNAPVTAGNKRVIESQGVVVGQLEADAWQLQVFDNPSYYVVVGTKKLHTMILFDTLDALVAFREKHWPSPQLDLPLPASSGAAPQPPEVELPAPVDEQSVSQR